MANLSGIAKQLKKERDRVQQQLAGMNAALEAFAGVYRGNNGARSGRKMSAQGQDDAYSVRPRKGPADRPRLHWRSA